MNLLKISYNVFLLMYVFMKNTKAITNFNGWSVKDENENE